MEVDAHLFQWQEQNAPIIQSIFLRDETLTKLLQF